MRTRPVVFTALAAVIAFGCGGGSSGKPTGKVRVLNLFSPDGGPGPAVDVYAAPDGPFTKVDTSQKPLLSNLAYEGLSDYFSPPAVGDQNSGVIAFFAAGTKEATEFYSGSVVPGSFAADEQALVTLLDCPDSTGAPVVCFNTLDEKSPATASSPAPMPSAGKAMFYDRHDVAWWDTDIFWWGAGAGCLTDGDSPYYDEFEIPAGMSTLTLLTKPGGTGNPTCMEAPTFSMPVDLAAGARAWLFTYGASQATLKQKWIPIE